MYPTLYLLHGLSDDHTIWQRRTSIERYAANYELAVVMPAVHRSFYADMTTGYRYFTYVTGELPSLVRSLFPLSEARKDNFVAGLSMGGYGAFKIAMTLPDQYAAAASLSGALDVVEGASYRDKEWQTELKAIFGKPRQLAGSANDLLHLAEELSVSKWKRMPLFQWCGTEDILITQNWRFRDHAKKLGLNLYYGEGPGEHEWGVWDQQIQRVLEWLPLKKTS
jgi:S-formylglutathione hydrolase FrmB